MVCGGTPARSSTAGSRSGTPVRDGHRVCSGDSDGSDTSAGGVAARFGVPARVDFPAVWAAPARFGLPPRPDFPAGSGAVDCSGSSTVRPTGSDTGTSLEPPKLKIGGVVTGGPTSNCWPVLIGALTTTSIDGLSSPPERGPHVGESAVLRRRQANRQRHRQTDLGQRTTRACPPAARRTEETQPAAPTAADARPPVAGSMR